MATRKITEIKDNATGDINQMRDNDIINNVPSTTSSDAAITTSVPLVAEDGSIVKIKRDSFVEAIASVFAANNQTTFSKLFGVNGTTPMGIEPSALASVLGGVFYLKRVQFICSSGNSYTVTTKTSSILFITTNSWDISMIILVSFPENGVKVLGYQAGGGKTVGTTSNDSVQISHSANSQYITITSNDMDREFHGLMLSY